MAVFTTKSTGMVFGLVKDHGNCELQEALSRIKKIPMPAQHFSVQVFRNVVRQTDVPQWTKKTVGPFIKDALELSMESIDDGKLYRKCRVDISKSSKGKSRRKIPNILRLLTENNRDVEGKLGVDRRSIVSYVERFFTRTTQNNERYLYIYNCESPPPEITSRLNGISGHLDPARNSKSKDMPGINKSMFYIGTPGSFTELHVEDSLADSANLIHAGKEKIWMIVDRDDYTRTNEIVLKKLRELYPHGDDDEDVAENCALVLQHKDLILTPAFLDENKIRYELVVQAAGDLVFVRYGVLHQVINVGVNIAEAINVGSDAWNIANDLKALCSCPKSRLSHIPTNTDVEMCAKSGKVKAKNHRCDTCGRIFGTKLLLAKHKKDDHDATVSCTICNKQFKHLQSLNRHVKITHVSREGAGIEPSECSIFTRTVTNMARHVQERHQKLVECSGCKVGYTRYELAQHEKRCIKFTCEACRKDFKTRHSLANHKARWCDK